MTQMRSGIGEGFYNGTFMARDMRQAQQAAILRLSGHNVHRGHRRQSDHGFGVNVESAFGFWVSAELQTMRQYLRWSLADSFSRENKGVFAV